MNFDIGNFAFGEWFWFVIGAIVVALSLYIAFRFSKKLYKESKQPENEIENTADDSDPLPSARDIAVWAYGVFGFFILLGAGIVLLSFTMNQGRQEQLDNFDTNIAQPWDFKVQSIDFIDDTFTAQAKVQGCVYRMEFIQNERGEYIVVEGSEDLLENDTRIIIREGEESAFYPECPTTIFGG